MRLPDGKIIRHVGTAYDPAYAHQYYLRTRHLKGRQKGLGQLAHPQSSHTNAKQKQQLYERIQSLETKLHALETLITKKEHEAASENRKSKAKKERAAKAKDKPATAAEKAKINRENQKYKDKHQQELKSKAKQTQSSASGGSSQSSSSSSSPSGGGGATISDLKMLSVKVKGQIAVAKQKLAAL